MAKNKNCPKRYEDFPEVVKQLNIIREFAGKMGYEIGEEYFTARIRNRNTGSFENTRAYSIEIYDKTDCEGNPYNWTWSMTTGMEL